jgi:cytoskeletal protein CcmA (bactofilin family)
MLRKNKKEVTGQTSSAINLVGLGTLIKGDLISEGDLRIDGALEGSIESKAKVAIGPSSLITGNVKARSADISGRIDGDLSIDETVYLRSTSQISGNISAGKLVIESGAVFNGTCNMGKPSESAEMSNEGPQV